MIFEYLLLPRLEVQTANAQSAWWLINCTPVMAVALFTHNLGRHVGVFPHGVGIVHHDAQLLGERFFGQFLPQQRRGAVFIDKHDYSSKNKNALSLQPTASCHLTLSLLLAFDSREGLPSPSKVERFLVNARLAGGQIISHGKPKPLNTRDEIQTAIRTGYWIVERTDLLEMSDEQGDPLDALIQACTRFRQRENGASSVTDQADVLDTWIVPTTLGYATLTEFAARKGAREGYLHAYAEPLVGLVQYVSVHRLADRPLPLWRYAWPREDVFIVTQKES
ncbi:type I-F CRISPR-associated protein Csy2 [Methylocaldum sp.]|jgi:CRISPR-associated protein Csy2|uniref:type I-F CRISPR-associated protein Csy2 n=1 Tax=Methylocaldum sp. TaxID=1969727 RepID=UPI00322010D5